MSSSPSQTPSISASAAVAPRKLPRQARSRAMVEAILETAARILEADGLAALNTNRVAAEAGVSVGSLYQYFPNKAALITALHERHVLQLAGRYAGALDGLADRGDGASRAPGDSLALAIAALVRAGLEAHRLEPRLHHVLEGEAANLDRPGAETEGAAAIAGQLRAFLERHRAETGPIDAGLATWTVMTMVEALVHRAVLEPPPFAEAAVERAIVAAVLGYLRAGAQ
ncbi:TetR/AcrR family transcriptional regulator [Derxia gummosa]|uniref:TetR/AcrR family transcriptional regulator n=1 Tax=Derxia gummosa DSM 723 TaxID=1121388 RepID=A0A9U5C5D3_9BURK|nr:TetR/AcrR family transcriptional regulator [Derxia gummosa]